MPLVKVLTSMVGTSFVYVPGDIVNVSQLDYEAFIRGGYAVDASAPPIETAMLESGKPRKRARPLKAARI